MLVALLAIVLAVGGSGFGQAARRRDLYGFDGATWSTDSVVVAVGPGSRPQALLMLLAVCVVIAGASYGMRRVLAHHLAGAAGRWPSWTVALAIVALAGVLATVGGYAATDVDDSPPAGWAVGHLLDDDTVDTELLTGYTPTLRAAERPTLPAEISFEVDGTTCAVVVEDPLVAVDGMVTLTPSCG